MPALKQVSALCIKWTKPWSEQLENSEHKRQGGNEVRDKTEVYGAGPADDGENVGFVLSGIGSCWRPLRIAMVWFMFFQCSQWLFWRTDCAVLVVGAGSPGNSPSCWFLLLPVSHLPSSIAICSRADCSGLSGNPDAWLQGNFESPKQLYISPLLYSPFLCNPTKMPAASFSWLHPLSQTLSLPAYMVKYCSDGAS